MRIIFMGTPQFAVPALQQLHNSSHEIIAVVIGTDQRSGRGRKMHSPPVALRARELGYGEHQILQPASLKDPNFLATIEHLQADRFVVLAFRLLPDILLALAKQDSVNLHPSQLPQYRGPAPIHHALLNGATTTGLTTIAISDKIDAGDILMQRTNLPIHDDDDLGSLSQRLAAAGAELLVTTLDRLAEGTIDRRKQESVANGVICRAPKITSADRVIDWRKSAAVIHNQVRAFAPHPGATTRYNHLAFKIYKSQRLDGSGEPGEILTAENERITICTGDGLLAATEVQLEGRKRMPVSDFLHGYTVSPGDRLE